jgi:type I restriction enzyme M protein
MRTEVDTTGRSDKYAATTTHRRQSSATNMDQAAHNKIVSFLWGIADDVLRDLFKRGKYPDVILPMCVLRRLDAVLEPTKKAVLDAKKVLDAAGITEQRAALCQAAVQAFYNTSKFTLRDLKSRGNQQQLKSDFEAYLEGFSSNVQEILDNFKFRNQLSTLSKADALGTLIEKFLDPEINLSPRPVLNNDGSTRYPAMDNHAMGTVFEELVRKFNEDNNEEAGQHWTPRDAVKLMADLVFLPVADKIESGSYLLYDGACGTGGMLTVAEERLQAIAQSRGKKVITHLYGQEINPETFAICKSDMLLKGEGENAEHIVGGAEWSTLSHDAYPAREFDFMLSNPPYGKSWKTDLETLGGKEGMSDPRFKADLAGEQLSLVTRSSDGQLLFLANMASKLNTKTVLGSRIAEVHNGSSLFTGDAGQGESNIRRWIITNDWLEAIVALPLNMFYNTGIATYIWVLTNKKPEHRRGKIQLIDATQWFRPLRKNLGRKNCELSEEDIRRICNAYLEFKQTEQSKIFSNEAFGYWKVTVERPLRLVGQLTPKLIDSIRFASGEEEIRLKLYDQFGEALFENFAKIAKPLEKVLAEWGSSGDEEGDDEEVVIPNKTLSEKKKKKLLDAQTWKRDARLVEVATLLRSELGGDLFPDYNVFRERASCVIETHGYKLSASEFKTLLRALSWRDENAPPVLSKVHKRGKFEPDPLRGFFAVELDGNMAIVEYEPDTELRDHEQVPLLENGGIEAFIRREVLPYAPDAWIDESKNKVGYEISFTRYFYKPQQLRLLDEIRDEIIAVDKKAEGLLDELLGKATGR